jgi:hypothetical protein
MGEMLWGSRAAGEGERQAAGEIQSQQERVADVGHSCRPSA